MESAVGLKKGKVVSLRHETPCAEYAKKQNKKIDNQALTTAGGTGSSKSMEANAAVQLFSEAVKLGVTFSTYVGDDDSTMESRLKALVNYNIKKMVGHKPRLSHFGFTSVFGKKESGRFNPRQSLAIFRSVLLIA